MKPTDKAILGMVSKSPGRNVSEPIGGLEKVKPRKPSPLREGEGSMAWRRGLAAWGAVVRDSNVSSNEDFGLICFGCTISDNVVANNGSDGIACFDILKGEFPDPFIYGCTISNNQVRGNDGIGIRAATSLVTGNTIIAGDGRALELDDFSGWSNNVIQDSGILSLTPAKGIGPIPGFPFPEIGGWIIDCNLVNTERFCWPSHIDD